MINYVEWLNIVWDKCSMGDRLYPDWSHTLYSGEKMKLQWGDKTFMACLEHIPWCIRFCSLDVERSEKKKKHEGFLPFSRKPEDKSWLHQNFSERGDTVSCRTLEVWKLQAQCAKILTHVCLKIFFLLTPNGSSNKEKRGKVDADCILILHSFILLIIYMSMHHSSYVTKEVLYWRWSYSEQ